MYGPPRDCKGKFGREDKSAAMYSAFGGVMSPGQDEFRCVSVLKVDGRRRPFGNRFQRRRFDCSFVLLFLCSLGGELP